MSKATFLAASARLNPFNPSAYCWTSPGVKAFGAAAVEDEADESILFCSCARYDALSVTVLYGGIFCPGSTLTIPFLVLAKVTSVAVSGATAERTFASNFISSASLPTAPVASIISSGE